MENREYREMEFLMRELHTEWERTGKTKKKLKVPIEADDKIREAIVLAVANTEKELEKDELTFKQMVSLSHENYIMLRIGKKLKHAEEHVRTGNAGLEMILELDKEECRVCGQILELKD